MPYSYYYGSYSAFLADNIYVVLLIPILLLSLWAQLSVNGNYRRYSAIGNHRGLTGASAAQAVLRLCGVNDVAIARTSGDLTDHYDPRDNTIYLSDGVYGEATIAAVGIACHEAGHALQYAEGYGPVRLRQAILPVTRFGSQASFLLLLIGMILYSQSLFLIGILLFATTTFFQLVTLPVEFNASARAVAAIEEGALLDGEELYGAKKVLRSAAWTYIASLLMSLLQLLRYVLIFVGRGSNRRGGRR